MFKVCAPDQSKILADTSAVTPFSTHTGGGSSHFNMCVLRYMCYSTGTKSKSDICQYMGKNQSLEPVTMPRLDTGRLRRKSSAFQCAHY
jgi:hypothetical protein